jgi:pimeloyl-ACP methyl ester carboxylesterase
MIQKFIRINNLQIAYREQNPDQTDTIFFIHGNSGSSRTWKNQLSDATLGNYRMIALDLPSHGDSASSVKPEADYNLPGLGKIVADFIQELSLDQRYIAVGFSLGSNILAEALRWIRPNGIVFSGCSVIGANHPLSVAFLPDVDNSLFFSDIASAESITNLPEYISVVPCKETAQLLSLDYTQVKPGFRPILIETAMQGQISDQIRLLNQTDVPALMVYGQQDKIVNINYLNDLPFPIWNNEFYHLPEAGHAVHLDQSQAFNKLLLSYILNMNPVT